MRKSVQYTLMSLVIIGLIAIPVIIFKNGEFTGTDDQAMTTIQNIDKSYQPWFKGVKLFKSQELQSIFFTLQAALGAGVLGYYIGYLRGRKSKDRHEK